MAIVAYEMTRSRSFVIGKDRTEGKLVYVVHGTNNDVSAKAAIAAAAPFTYPGVAGLVRQNIDIHTIGGLMWYADVPYRPDDAPLLPAVGLGGAPLPVPAGPTINQPIGADFAFDLTAQTEHITQSLQTVESVKRGGGVAKDNKRAIGITKTGEVKGCDRFKPYLEWAVSKTFDAITMAYIHTITDMVGTVNSNTFYGGEAGTQMFLGASGNTKDIDNCVITFKFARQKNRTAIEILPDLVIASKKGWEYLWVSYKSADDALQLTQQPEAAYVEKIYESTDFADLRIGI
jgi:hypothetical protein